MYPSVVNNKNIIFHFFFYFVVIYSTMFTASTDKTLGIWDYETGARIKKLKGHSSFVNSCFPSRRGPQYVVSGADDCTVKVCTKNSQMQNLVVTRKRTNKINISNFGFEFWFTIRLLSAPFMVIFIVRRD